LDIVIQLKLQNGDKQKTTLRELLKISKQDYELIASAIICTDEIINYYAEKSESGMPLIYVDIVEMKGKEYAGKLFKSHELLQIMMLKVLELFPDYRLYENVYAYTFPDSLDIEEIQMRGLVNLWIKDINDYEMGRIDGELGTD